MINRNHKISISISTQAQLLGFSRGMMYYKPKAISETTLVLMHAIDRLHIDYPFMYLNKNPIGLVGFLSVYILWYELRLSIFF